MRGKLTRQESKLLAAFRGLDSRDRKALVYAVNEHHEDEYGPRGHRIRNPKLPKTYIQGLWCVGVSESEGGDA